MKGFGTVVTGTLVAGRISAEAELEAVLSGRRLKVRGVQVHGASATVAEAGQRTALNLSSVEVADLGRGEVLAASRDAPRDAHRGRVARDAAGCAADRPWRARAAASGHHRGAGARVDRRAAGRGRTTPPSSSPAAAASRGCGSSRPRR